MRTESSHHNHSDIAVTWSNRESDSTFHSAAVIVKFRTRRRTFKLSFISVSEDLLTDFIAQIVWTSFIKTFFCHWAASAISWKMTAFDFSLLMRASNDLIDLNVDLNIFTACSWSPSSLFTKLRNSSSFTIKSSDHNSSAEKGDLKTSSIRLSCRELTHSCNRLKVRIPRSDSSCDTLYNSCFNE